jgi:hypothetical protein
MSRNFSVLLYSFHGRSLFYFSFLFRLREREGEWEMEKFWTIILNSFRCHSLSLVLPSIVHIYDDDHKLAVNYPVFKYIHVQIN